MTTAPTAAGEAMPTTRTIKIDPVVALNEQAILTDHWQNRALALAQELHETRAGNKELAAKVEELTAALEASGAKKKG